MPAADPSFPAPWRELARASGPGGEWLVLRESGGTFEIRLGGWDLMSNRACQSERELGRLGCAGLASPAPRVLVGGLGMGFTLRAALDALPATARVVVVEIVPAVVEWNRGPLAALAGRPLEDARVTVHCADVAAALERAAFDAILLDIDNGPGGAMPPAPGSLYADEGLRRLHDALVPGGRLAVWSADPSPAFEERMSACGLNWRGVAVSARGGGGDDPQHTLYLAALTAV